MACISILASRALSYMGVYVVIERKYFFIYFYIRHFLNYFASEIGGRWPKLFKRFAGGALCASPGHTFLLNKNV